MIYNFDELSFQILSIMRSKHPKGRYVVKGRPYAALSFKIHGSAEFETGDREFSVGEKCIVYIPAYTDYTVNYTEENDSIVVHLTDCNYDTAEGIAVKSASFMEHAFLTLHESFSENHSMNYAKASVFGILHELSCETCKSQSKMFLDILELIKSDFCNADFNVHTICKHYGISRSRLQSLFLESVSKPPKQYICDLRMENALGLLIEGGLSVNDVAMASGFSDVKYFARAFKKKYSCPPSEMRHKASKK